MFVSTRGGDVPVRFDQAVLKGFADDGGMFMPQEIPRLSLRELRNWQSLGYVELARQVLRRYVDASVVPDQDLSRLLAESFASFSSAEIVPLVQPGSEADSWIMELFHGPTLSFKDVAMGFLINLLDYFLEREDQRVSLILATTGDTGPAAAYASAGKERITCWPLYPASMITPEQELQMTTIAAANVNPVAVTGCANGGDDLDIVVARLFSDIELKRRLQLSSVNSINIGRVLMQTVHYFYGYFRVAREVGDTVVFSVPAGAFGNLCAAELARAMGLPITFICATNRNRTLHRIFAEGVFTQAPLQQSLSSAIDIVIPYNFWRFLYLRCGCDAGLIRRTMTDLGDTGSVRFDDALHRTLQEGVVSTSVSDQQTGEKIRTLFTHAGYLVDPHGAVALCGVDDHRQRFAPGTRFISLATAHPAKFPDVMKEVLATDKLPEAAGHPSLQRARVMETSRIECTCGELEQRLVSEIEASLAG